MVFSSVMVEDVVDVVNVAGVAVAVPEGDTDVVRLIGLVCPPKYVAVNVAVIVAGVGHADTMGPGLLNEKPAGGVAMVKLLLEISKKIFPIDSIFTRAVVVRLFGMVTDSVPSFGVLAASTIGKVSPPSVDRLIFTLAQLIGAPVVPATSQVMV